jgi:hypothetical protein
MDCTYHSHKSLVLPHFYHYITFPLECCHFSSAYLPLLGHVECPC